MYTRKCWRNSNYFSWKTLALSTVLLFKYIKSRFQCLAHRTQVSNEATTNRKKFPEIRGEACGRSKIIRNKYFSFNAYSNINFFNHLNQFFTSVFHRITSENKRNIKSFSETILKSILFIRIFQINFNLNNLHKPTFLLLLLLKENVNKAYS